MLTLWGRTNSSNVMKVIWLLEELGLAYEIKHYQRNAKTMLAPPELLAIHPLGKSPVVTDDGVVIAEGTRKLLGDLFELAELGDEVADVGLR